MGKYSKLDSEKSQYRAAAKDIVSDTQLAKCHANNGANLRAKCSILVEIPASKFAVFSGGYDAVTLDADTARSTNDWTCHVPVYLILRRYVHSRLTNLHHSTRL